MADTTTRNMHLGDVLSGRQRELQEDLQRRVRDGRTGRLSDVGDELDDSDATSSEDVEFALLGMKADTLSRIDEALSRLDTGAYGRCFECGSEISTRRLRALPFAARCTMCEETREHGQAQTRWLGQRHESASPYGQG